MSNPGKKHNKKARHRQIRLPVRPLVDEPVSLLPSTNSIIAEAAAVVNELNKPFDKGPSDPPYEPLPAPTAEFKDLEEETDYYMRQGWIKKVSNPATKSAVWEDQQIIPAIQLGLIDLVAMTTTPFDDVPKLSAFKCTEDTPEKFRLYVKALTYNAYVEKLGLPH